LAGGLRRELVDRAPVADHCSHAKGFVEVLDEFGEVVVHPLRIRESESVVYLSDAVGILLAVFVPQLGRQILEL
jgi:hypothetical protein